MSNVYGLSSFYRWDPRQVVLVLTSLSCSWAPRSRPATSLEFFWLVHFSATSPPPHPIGPPRLILKHTPVTPSSLSVSVHRPRLLRPPRKKNTHTTHPILSRSLRAGGGQGDGAPHRAAHRQLLPLRPRAGESWQSLLFPSLFLSLSPLTRAGQRCKRTSAPRRRCKVQIG
jgi:hypothetical protein